MRVSHADRDRTVERLRVAAGEGRLTVAELEERLEAALEARVFDDLAALTADLPADGVPGDLAASGIAVAPPGTVAAVPRDVLRIDRVGGGARRSGPWVLPRRIEVSVIGGSVRLDLGEAVVMFPVLEIDVAIKGGTLLLTVPPDVVVDTDEVSAIGGGVRQRAGLAATGAVRLRVVVTGSIHGGNVVVRGSRSRRSPRRAGR
jgi:hypothetical protein